MAQNPLPVLLGFLPLITFFFKYSSHLFLIPSSFTSSPSPVLLSMHLTRVISCVFLLSCFTILCISLLLLRCLNSHTFTCLLLALFWLQLFGLSSYLLSIPPSSSNLCYWIATLQHLFLILDDSLYIAVPSPSFPHYVIPSASLATLFNFIKYPVSTLFMIPFLPIKVLNCWL